MRRREFIALVSGGIVAAPLSIRAQSQAMPVIGFLNSGSKAAFEGLVKAFGQGLNEEGYAEGRNVVIEYRWAEGNYDRLKELASDLIRNRVTLIAATGGTMSARAAKDLTDTIPLLFVTGSDPVGFGLAASISRPGGNATGVSVITTDLVGKRLEWLRRLVPSATTIGMLVNPNAFSTDTERRFAVETERKEAATATTRAGLTLLVFEAHDEGGLEIAFDAAAKKRVDALFVSADPFLTDRRRIVISLAERYRIPVAYPWRQFAVDGGLMSYGPNLAEVYRQIGRYAGRILKGEKPGELPVQMPTKFELIINRKTARALGIEVSAELLTVADEVIE
jgi:putative ABC transport system substrate-binding protein